tara:strand:+ start:852 stop:1742 length:891 start_codon:yes stop_codon:yes gene_type:complete
MAYEDYTQITREAPYLEDFRRRFLQGAFDLTKQPGTTSPERGIAGLDVFQTGAMDQYAANMGIDPKTGLPTGAGASFDPYFKAGLGALESAQKQYDPSTSNYKQFQNQYQADVTNEALKQMDQQAQLAQNKLAGDAVQGGAFGGSRFAVEKSQLDSNLQDIKSRRIFQDLAQNFEQAQNKAIGTFESARARDMSAASMFPSLGAQQFNLQGQGLGQLFNFGTGRQAFDQGKLDEQFRVSEAKRLDPYNRLSYFGDVLAGVPSVSQTLTQKPLPYTNPLTGGIGAAMSAYGLMNQKS